MLSESSKEIYGKLTLKGKKIIMSWPAALKEHLRAIPMFLS